ncbi:NAD-glutamate dehydrogenase [Hyphococcus luteus]|uniref:NAD-glutamate dehydrogenase n=1 Tax=Hyphococcus luteus TaxID=2058213 RepID=A0A2S7K250_9PROT|nr:NAD-glutamate dehydrogenase [Marinicaulis flavus]PQA86518.1 NAD-glutamate dehydrogenase [Marinicaulis flavus]
MPEGFITDVDSQILDQVIALAQKKKVGDVDENGALAPAFKSYIEQLVLYATGEDRNWNEPQSLLNRAAAAWKHGAVRKPGESNISLRLEEGKTWSDRRMVLDIVTDDKPFLVDSISAALADAGKPVSFFSNAVVAVARNAAGKRDADGQGALRESMIHVEMDPPVIDNEIEALRDEIKAVLSDVAIAVEDWEPMRARLGSCIAQLERSRLPGVKADEQREAVQFLKWLWDNRFAFLGVRHFDKVGEGGTLQLEVDADKDLGILRNPGRNVLMSTFQPDGDLSPAVASFLASKEPILIAKSSSKSLTHRRAYMDYVAVKSFAPDGTAIGEELFVGLFTAEAYNRPASDIPLIRAKLDAVLERTAFTPGGHNEKALINILESCPRDELFQVDVDTLTEMALGILRLYKRPRVKLFLRRDRFDRFVSALLYVPRDRFNSDIRERAADLLAESFDGKVMSFAPFFGDAALVRVHFIIGIKPGAPQGPGVQELTRQMREICRTWTDGLLEAMREAHDGATPAALYAKYEKAFDAGYRERTPAEETLSDIAALEQLDADPMVVRAYRKPGDGEKSVRIKIYKRGEPMSLSKLIPTIENLGLSVLQEASYQVSPFGGGKESFWIHDFNTEQTSGQPITLPDVKEAFEETILAVVEGRTEDDGFNELVLTAGVNWREAWLLRAAAKHHLQSGFAYSQAYIQEALANHPAIARKLVAAFHARFNPEGPSNADARIKDVEKADNAVREALDDVASLDQDRIISRFLNLFCAITRTNYYQREKDGSVKTYISFKIDSSKLAELPEPKPYREIFVSGPRVDGVHLRFGPVARGGLRWSDRREDFRTEVLGLVKAQRVKNAVIVPTGSKGGFYPKQLPASGDRTAVYEEGREAYKIFIRGLLDLTDNIVKGEPKTPAKIVRWDDPDAYLVVAADKGTAAFSDTANAISKEYGFWLGDAFASGGSAGYDHKVMGITARGAWEAVKRHFREMGKDIQTEPFTAAGVGDMSGDVFGNGMLLSEQTKLVAAFDHRDIFIDPDPDPAKTWKERKRLFDLPRSSWADYDKKLISKGGGVFSRNAKSIAVTPEMRALLDITDKTMTPAELIQAILKAPVELFWLGGIGTYFKAEDEENWRVGDRTNDAVRVNASETRAKVIGEGANLGLTQLARIEYARGGGRINTDAIDNSAGVDSSDHEVNIKILLSGAIEHGELKREDRDPLLASMTDDVAEHVLRHNYDQTRAVTQMEMTAPAELDIYARFMSTLEREGRLDRAIEYLPDTEELAHMRQHGLGPTRPDLAVLLAYAKMWLFDEIVESQTPDDPLFEGELFAYFPDALHQFNHSVVSHQLRREIIATRLSNEIVDTCGVSFVQRAAETSGVDFATITLAYEAVRRIYNLNDFAAAVDALDNQAPASLQTALYLEASRLLSGQTFHLLGDAKARDTLTSRGLKAMIEQYQAPVAEFKTALPDILPAEDAGALEERRQGWIAEKAPEDIARLAASIPALEFAFDIVNLARETGWSNPGVGGVFFAVGRLFNIDAMRDKARAEPPADHFDKIALRQIIEELTARQRLLTARVIAAAGAEPKGAAAKWTQKVIDKWRSGAEDAIALYNATTDELDLSGPVSVGKFTLFIRQLDALAEDTAV